MQDRLATRTFASLLALLLALAAPSLANDTIAKIENAGEALIFHPAARAALWTLAVDGPCNFRFETTSKGGELVFKLGEETADGRYGYRLQATRKIAPEIFEILREARATGDNGRVNELCRAGKLEDPTRTQSGNFAVVEGRIVFDPVPEIQRKTDYDLGEEKAAELAPIDRTGAEVHQASTRPAPSTDSDSLSEPTFVVARAEPTCDWARMEGGAGVAER